MGDRAPDFSLPSHLGGRIILSDYLATKNVLIAFYPMDWTPVCTSQIPGYERDLPQFEKQDTQVLGISVDSIPCHQSWQKTLGGISFPILSDYWPHGKVCRKFGVLTDSGYCERVIFIIDKKGIIRFIENHGLQNYTDNERILRMLGELK